MLIIEQLPVNICTKEVMEDGANLEREYGVIVRGMAYPFGTYNDSVVATLKQCGIVYARTVEGTFSVMPGERLVIYNYENSSNGRYSQ